MANTQQTKSSATRIAESSPFLQIAAERRERDAATGRVRSGNQLARKHPKPPDKDDPALANRLATRRDAIISERGGPEQLTTVQVAAIDRFVMLELFVESWEQHFLCSGLMSRQGRVRSGYAQGYLATVTQLLRLAQLIGLDRIAKPVLETPSDWLRRSRAARSTDPLEDTASTVDPV